MEGQPVKTIIAILEDMLTRYSPGRLKLAAATGTGGRLIADILGLPFVNEIIAQAAGTARFYPEVKPILEIGGEDSKLIVPGRESPNKPPRITNFTMNGACAAGTGSFLDQQASRMDISIEQFGDIALKSYPNRYRRLTLFF
jgi:activator of 2-hydroxyglutaryl-CoA dehydratase